KPRRACFVPRSSRRIPVIRKPDSTKKSCTPTQPDSAIVLQIRSGSARPASKMLRLWMRTTTIAIPRTVSRAGIRTFDSDRDSCTARSYPDPGDRSRRCDRREVAAGEFRVDDEPERIALRVRRAQHPEGALAGLAEQRARRVPGEPELRDLIG